MPAEFGFLTIYYRGCGPAGTTARTKTRAGRESPALRFSRVSHDPSDRSSLEDVALDLDPIGEADVDRLAPLVGCRQHVGLGVVHL